MYKATMPEEFAPLVWIAIETSGPSAQRDTILGIASLVTTAELQLIAHGPALDGDANEPADPAAMSAQTLVFLNEHCEAGQSPLCGSRMGHTRRFLGRHMPELDAFLHYRTIDIRTIEELARRWFPARRGPELTETGSASASLRASLGALVDYRAQLFVAPESSPSPSGSKP